LERLGRILPPVEAVRGIDSRARSQRSDKALHPQAHEATFTLSTAILSRQTRIPTLLSARFPAVTRPGNWVTTATDNT